MTKRVRDIPLLFFVKPQELEQIEGRMADLGMTNRSAYLRKMALNGYILNVDLAPVRELVRLQRRCAANMNQIAIQANTYGGIYPAEVAALQSDYRELWGRVSDLLKQLAAVVAL